MRKVVLGAIGLVVVAVLFVVLCTFVKRPYEKVLLVRFGSLIDEQNQTRICYNWYFKLPTDSVVPFDTRLHLYTSPLIQITTAAKDTISVQTFVAWRIVDPVKFYQNTGGGSDKRAESQIGQIIQGRVPDQIGKHPLEDLFNTDEKKVKTGEIEAEVAKLATEDLVDENGKVKTQGLRSMGIQMVEIGFSRMAFAPENAGPVYSRMAAELSAKAQGYATEGVAQANIIRSQGLADAAKEISDATAKAQNIRGQGDAEANKILAAVQTTPQAVAFYQYWKSMEFLKSSLSKNTVLVLPSDSPLLDPAFGSSKGALTMPTPATLPAMNGVQRIVP